MVAVKDKLLLLPDGRIDMHAWLEKIVHQYAIKNSELLKKSCFFTEKAGQGLTTFYGQPCIEQSLEMAEMILNLKLDEESVAAAILTSIMQHNTMSIEKIIEHFGEAGEGIAKLITGIQQMNVINNLANTKSRNQIQIDRLRKTLLAMVSDIRVVLIKLAERTCLMRGIKNINAQERKRLAQETMDIYAPLANRLGIGQLKWELEDLAFHYIDPTTYKNIAHFLAERRVNREARIHETISRLKKEFAKANIQAEFSGRAKHIHSIYLKAQHKHLDFHDIYDYSAVRVLVPSRDDCYTALSIVHSLWEHIPEEFDDYITNPKPNGYRSIHTAVIGPDGKNLEIQIRTHNMHDEAEHGVAAHWLYKEKKTHHSGYEAKITFLRQLLAWHKEVAEDETKENKINQQILEDRVYVFTPLGEILDLPVGATPLDFAYQVHSNLGHRVRGAKANGHIVPLTYTLQMGDQIEILANKQGSPSRDWLNKSLGYIKTTRARAKVAQWFKQQDAEQPVEVEKPKVLIAPAAKSTKVTQPTPKTTGLKIAGVDDLLTRIARCCKPIPGDPIIGFITQGRGVSIHRKNCSNIHALIKKNGEHNRMLTVSWEGQQLHYYYVDLQIRAYKQDNLLKEITAILAHDKIELLALNSTISKKNNMIYVTITVKIHDIKQLQQITTHLSHLPHVADIKRIRE